MSYVHACFRPGRALPVWTKPKPWSEADDAALMDAIADGVTFTATAERLGRSKNSVVGRFNRVAAGLGAQAS